MFERASAAVVFVETDRSSGTGFLLRSTGIVATCNHVIEDAVQVSIRTKGGEVFDSVQLLARDERRDIAILRVAGFKLPEIELADSDLVRPGQHVTVIGNPLGMQALQASVTDGVVSGMRDFGWGYQVLQISAPISRGNSGGPVLDDNARVVGVAAFKIITGENLNFAVPINYVRGLIGSLSANAPIKKWEGKPKPDNVLTSAKPDGLSDYWKSSNGNLYFIKDHGNQVKILNMTYTSYTYDFKWSGGLIVGYLYGGGTEVCVLKKQDEDHLLRVCFGYKKEFADEARIRAEAEKRFSKPRDIWIRVR